MSVWCDSKLVGKAEICKVTDRRFITGKASRDLCHKTAAFHVVCANSRNIGLVY